MISGNGGSIRRSRVRAPPPRDETQRSVLTLDRIVIVAVIAGAALWIEHGHRTVTDAPTRAELDALAAARACPDNENMPYTPACLAFLQGSAGSELRWRPTAAGRVPAERAFMPKDLELTSVAPRAACADSDAMPYTSNCIAFMTGWFWQPNTR
jgi:hypothetical protein